jgi:hypothetical protein
MLGHVDALEVTAELCQEILFFPSDDLALLETVPNSGKPHLYHVAARLCILSPNFTFLPQNIPLFSSDFTSIQSTNEIAMAPKRKNQSSAAVVIPPIDLNSQLPFVGNHMSVVSESDLLCLVDVGVLPPKVLCSWRICRGVTVPTEDTLESFVYVPFLIRGLALPISPFFRGLLDFYNLNLTHLNPNSILQISIFVHLCEAYLRILSHFGLWKYLYHCRPRMAGGSTSSWVVRVWRCAAEGKQNTLIFRLRTSLKGGALSGLLWKTIASPSPSVGETARCAHSKLD